LNSLKSLQTAAAYEIARQIALNEEIFSTSDGGAAAGAATTAAAVPSSKVVVKGETRSFNALTGKTTRMRGKEGVVDYRFFPEPDLPPLVLEEGGIEEVREGLPELPQATRARLEEQFGLTPCQASVLAREGGRAVRFFEEVVEREGGKGGREGRNVANWVCNDLVGLLKAKAAAAGAAGTAAGTAAGGAGATFSSSSSSAGGTTAEAAGAGGGGGGGGEGGLLSSTSCLVTPAAMGELIDLVASGAISIRTGKEVLGLMVEGEVEGGREGGRMMPSEIVETRGWGQVSDEEVLREVARKVVRDPASGRQRKQYREGKERQMMKYFVGQAMKATGGRAHPEKMEGLLREVLGEGGEEEGGGGSKSG
jgi:aspartyl-tRNA(Asn)/glutamyl-tRNA(Gln) amidotransferase subunit B